MKNTFFCKSLNRLRTRLKSIMNSIRAREKIYETNVVFYDITDFKRCPREQRCIMVIMLYRRAIKFPPARGLARSVIWKAADWRASRTNAKTNAYVHAGRLAGCRGVDDHGVSEGFFQHVFHVLLSGRLTGSEFDQHVERMYVGDRTRVTELLFHVRHGHVVHQFERRQRLSELGTSDGEQLEHLVVTFQSCWRVKTRRLKKHSESEQTSFSFFGVGPRPWQFFPCLYSLHSTRWFSRVTRVKSSQPVVPFFIFSGDSRYF